MALFDGVERRLDREHDERMQLAWVIAMLPHQKTLRLDALLSKKRKRRHTHDPSKEADRLKAWAASCSRS